MAVRLTSASVAALVGIFLVASFAPAALVLASTLPTAPPPAPAPFPPPAPSSDPAPPTATTIPDGGSRLVVVPPSCAQLEPAAVAFVGTVIGKDDVVQVVRFEIDQLRSGSARPWAIDGFIDVRFGDDYRFLDVDEQYLVGAGFDAEYGALSSTVRPPEPEFGGNDVVGVDDSSVECPVVDAPIRTLNVDGSDVDSGVLSLLFDDRRVLLATVAVPTAIVLVALVVLVLLRMVGGLASKGVFELGRAAVTPVPDHRAVRVRRHRNET